MNFIFVGVAGSLGALARYCIYLIEPQLHSRNFPYGTLIINLSGCFLAGALFALSTRLIPEHKESITLLLIGFVGSFTTFSTFGMESLQLLETNASGHALLNIALNVVGGLAMIWIGRTLVNAF